ncbi:MAG: hypothetical protein ACE5R4_07465 [Armatimonadota bacterium]
MASVKSRTAVRVLGVLVAVALMAIAAQAQVQGIISIDLKDQPLAEALAVLQRDVPGFNYQLDPAVRGNVTVSLRDIDINAALGLILSSVGATYRIDQGTYVIEPKPMVAPTGRLPLGPTGLRAPVRTPPPAPAPGTGAVTAAPATGEGEEELVVRRIRVKRADPVDVALVFGGTVVSSRMGQLAGFGGGGGGWGGGGWGGGGWGGGGWGGGGGGGWGGGGWGGGGRGGWGGGGWGGGGRGGWGGGGFGGRGFGGGFGGRGFGGGFGGRGFGGGW